MSLPTLQSVFSADQIDALNAWITNQVSIQAVKLVDTSNTGSGTTSCTINGRSGVATFSSVLSAGMTRTYTITNSSVTSTSVINFGLKYAAAGAGSPVLLNYAVGTGSFTFHMKNVHDSDATNSNLIVEFQFS